MCPCMRIALVVATMLIVVARRHRGQKRRSTPVAPWGRVMTQRWGGQTTFSLMRGSIDDA